MRAPHAWDYSVAPLADTRPTEVALEADLDTKEFFFCPKLTAKLLKVACAKRHRARGGNTWNVSTIDAHCRKCKLGAIYAKRYLGRATPQPRGKKHRMPGIT